MKINNHIVLDFNKTKQVDTQTIQCDMNSRFVRVSLRHNNSPINLSDVRVCIMAVKPDGKEIFNDCTVIDAQNGIAEFEITKQMGIVVGEVECQIKLFGPNQLLSSNIFRLSVRKTLSPSSESSEDQLNTLVNALGEVQDIDNRFKQTDRKIDESYEKVNAQLSHLEYYVTPKKFNDDIQQAIDYAISIGVRRVILEAKTYTLNDTLLVPSNFTLEGVKGESIIKLLNVDKPVIGHKGSITGSTHLKYLVVVGDKTQPNNRGIVLNDYWSEILGCEVRSCGAEGIYISDAGASGTLVENKIQDCVVRDCASTSYHLGNSTNKITDGYLINCISAGSGSNKAIYCGSSAGWTFNGVHTYGHSESSGVVTILNAFNTLVNNFYVENFKSVCFDFHKVQRNLNISNITLNFSNKTTDNVAFAFNHSTAINATSNINLSNVSVTVNSDDINNYLLGGDDSAWNANVSNVSKTGLKASTLIFAKPSLSKARYNLINQVSVLGSIALEGDIDESNSYLRHNGVRLSKFRSGKFGGSNSERVITIPLLKFDDYEKIIASFKVHSSKYYNSTKRISCHTELYITSKTGTTTSVYQDHIIQPTGFTQNPTYSIDKASGTLTITFTPEHEDGEGAWVFEMYHC